MVERGFADALFAYGIAVQRTHNAGEPMVREKYRTPMRNENRALAEQPLQSHEYRYQAGS